MNRVCIIGPGDYRQPIIQRSVNTLVREGYEVDIICRRGVGEKKQETVAGATVYRLRVEHRRESLLRYCYEYSVFFTLASLKLSWLSLKKRYDVVQICTMPDLLVFTTVFARLLGSKVVLYMFEYMPELFASTFDKGEGHPVVKLLRLLERASTHYAHHIIVVCENQKKRVAESNGLPGNKVTVVLNVPDEAIFDQKAMATRKDENRFRLITHGTLLKRQGMQTLISAVPLLIGDIPELRVDIVGDGEYRPKLEKLAQDLGVSKYINFTGWVALDKIPFYIAQADVGVVAHLVDLMLPHKVFEYLAMGKPVVASDHSHLRNYFDQDIMLFYPPGDERALAHCILELYRNSPKRDSLASHARAFYPNFRWSVIKREYLKVYEELLT